MKLGQDASTARRIANLVQDRLLGIRSKIWVPPLLEPLSTYPRVHRVRYTAEKFLLMLTLQVGRRDKGPARSVLTVKDTGPIVYKFRVSNVDDHVKKKPLKKRGRSVTNAYTSFLSHSPSIIHASLPSHYELSRNLVYMIETSNIGSRIHTVDSFIRALPRRIGHSSALDSAITCLVHAHSSTQSFRNVIDDPKLYLSAVQDLQVCLANGENIKSPNTLGAAVVLSIVEVLAGPTLGNCYLAHIDGASRLLEIQGPEGCQDTFVKDILYFVRGSIVSSHTVFTT